MRATRDLIESQVSRFLKLCSKWTLSVQGFQIAEYVGTDKEESIKLFNEALNVIEQEYQNETIELKYGDTNSNGSFKRVQTAQFIIDSKDNTSNINIFNPQQQANNQIFNLSGVGTNNQSNQTPIQVLHGLIEAGIGRAREEMKAENEKQIAKLEAQFIIKTATMEADSIKENAKREAEKIIAEAQKKEEEVNRQLEELEEKLEELEEKQNEIKQGVKSGIGGIVDYVKDSLGMNDLKGIKKNKNEDTEEEVEEKSTRKTSSSFANDIIEEEIIEEKKEQTKNTSDENGSLKSDKINLDEIISKLNKEEAQLLGFAILDKYPELNQE